MSNSVANFPKETVEIGSQTFQFIQQYLDKEVWDVSIQKPTRKFLGKIEYSDGKWFVVKVEREEFTGVAYRDEWEDCAKLLDQMVRERNVKSNVARLKSA